MMARNTIWSTSIMINMLVNKYNDKHEAGRDAREFNHTKRWHAILIKIACGYELYVRKLYA